MEGEGEGREERKGGKEREREGIIFIQWIKKLIYYKKGFWIKGVNLITITINLFKDSLPNYAMHAEGDGRASNTCLSSVGWLVTEVMSHYEEP